MSKSILYVFLMVCASAAHSSEIEMKTKTPLLGITGVIDASSTVVEPEASSAGGMEMKRFFATHLYSEILGCGKVVSNVFSSWLKEHKMIATENRVSDKELFIRVWDKQQTGVFEASYLLNKKPTYVRVGLDFYSISGKHLPVETIHSLITTYKISELWDSLADAIECDA